MNTQLKFIKKLIAVTCFLSFASITSTSYAQELTHMNSTARTHVTVAYNVFECPNLKINDGVGTMGKRKKDGSFKRDGNGDCRPYKLPNNHALVITDVSWRTNGTSSKSLQLHVDTGEIGNVDSEDNRIFWGLGEINNDHVIGNVSILGGRVVYSPGNALDAWSGIGNELYEVFITGYHVRY